MFAVSFLLFLALSLFFGWLSQFCIRALRSAIGKREAARLTYLHSFPGEDRLTEYQAAKIDVSWGWLATVLVIAAFLFWLFMFSLTVFNQYFL